jgi:hypothetical protein
LQQRRVYRSGNAIEGVFINLQRKLPKGDPRGDSLANTFEAYQNTALVLKANEQGKANVQMQQSQRPGFAKFCSQKSFRTT